MSDEESQGLVREQAEEKKAGQGPLAAFDGAVPPAPDWFTRMIAVPVREGETVFEGARITWRQWGDPAKPGLLFSHGNAAHAHWWDFIAPWFAADWNVVALTFSGMGDSGWRESYDLELFAREQMAVCEATGMFDAAQPPVLVSHSFGGFVAIVTGALYGERLGGSVIVDSPVNPPDPDRMRRDRGAPRTNRVYPTLEAALARFRLAPVQPAEALYALDYIARHSLKQVEGGWQWKFDPSIWRRFEVRQQPADLLRETKCRLAILRGEDSVLMPQATGDYMRALLGHQVPFISIPEARHHIMLDQPLAFVAALRTLLEEWRHSEPHRGR